MNSSRQDTKNILDRVADENPNVIEDLVPKLLPLATVQRVLKNRLRDRVSIRDAVTVLEALGEAAAMTKNPMLLTEYGRQAIRRLLVKPYLNAAAELSAFFLDPALEQTIEGAVERGEQTSHMNLGPRRIRARITRAVGALVRAASPLLATPADDRVFASPRCREESRHGTHECVRHVVAGLWEIRVNP